MAYQPSNIRNICLVGHGASGKTMLAEGLLLKAGVTSRLGRIDDKNTVCDFETEEKKRGISIDSAVCHLTHDGKEVNIIDTPGYPDFIADAIAALRAADAAVFCVDANAGIKVNTRKLWGVAGTLQVPRFVVVTRTDVEHGRFDGLLDELASTFDGRFVALTCPDQVGPGLSAVEAVLPLADGASDRAQAFHDTLIEAAVETDDELMMRYLEGEEISPDEIRGGLKTAVGAGSVFPVLATSVEKNLGLELLLDRLVELVPPGGSRTFKAVTAESRSQRQAAEKREVPDGEEAPELPPLEEVEVSAGDPFSAFVFKIIRDPFVGKVSFLRVAGGSFTGGEVLTQDGNKIKVQQLLRPQGKEFKEVNQVVAGDVVAVSKIEELEISDTLSLADFHVAFPPIDFPTPMVSYAISPTNRGDEGKLWGALRRLADEDPTFLPDRRKQTREMVVSGMSNLHLDIMLGRLKERFEVAVESRPPKIPYLETISRKAEGSYRHKKQSGGRGQFGECHLRLEPMPRSEGFQFLDEVVGGVIPNQYIPAVEKGVVEAMEKGIVAGYPMVDVSVAVFFGKSHPVDSSETAFKIAGARCFQEVAGQAKPVLLEPVMDVEVTVPTEYMGDIMGDLNGRRGRIQNTRSEGNYQTIEAKVPLSEITTYSTELRSITGGEGSYSVEFSHYDPVPGNVAQQVVAQAQKEKEES